MHLIIAAAACAPGNVSEFAPSRRDLIRALALPALAITPAPTVASPSAVLAIDRVQWNIRLKAFLDARDRAELHRETIMRPISEELSRRTPRPVDTFTVVAKNGVQASYRLRADNLDQYDGFPAFERQANPLKAAIRDFPKKRAAALRDLDFGRHEEEEQRLDDLWFEAERNLIETPAPDAQALATKLRILFIDGCDTLNDIQRDAILADAHRFGGAA